GGGLSPGVGPAVCGRGGGVGGARGERPGRSPPRAELPGISGPEPPSTTTPPAGPPRRPLENQAMDPRREPTGAPASDSELVLRYKATRDPVLVGTLFERYAHLALAVSFRYLRQREDAEDAVIQVYHHLLPPLLPHALTTFT